MAKVLYKAYNQEGKESDGFIEAINNKEAVKVLKEQGFSGINLYSDTAIGIERPDLEGLSEKELKKIAEFEIKLQKGVGFSAYFLETMSNNLIPMTIGLALGAYGYSESSWVWISTGAIIASALPFFSFWNYGIMQTHSALLKAVTFGEWEEVKVLSEQLKMSTKNREVQLEADTKLATYYAYHHDMDKALNILSSYHDDFIDRPGVYENKLGELYAHDKSYDKTIFQMKRAYQVSSENMMLGDWALAEARFGDIKVAKENLRDIDVDALPAYGVAFVAFIEGLIAYKEHDLQKAKESLTQAYEGFVVFDKNPAVWAPLAMVSCTLALVLNALGERKRAEGFLGDGIVKIAKEHAEADLLEKLEKEFPFYF